MKEKCYIAGAIETVPMPIAKRYFRNGCQTMQTRGYDTVNPFDLKPFLGIRKWFFFMITDIRVLRRCQAAAFLPNWKQSRGACIERYFCLTWKIKIIDL